MGSNSSQRLKAYVRFDGSGRIVAGSLILRRKKPKVGKWVEIPAYECCNPTTTSTTTATPVSDRRLKRNIQLTGNYIGGLPEYRWEWNAKARAIGIHNHPTTGVIAQEALEHNPDFVVFDHSIGYLRVRYDNILKA